MTGGNYSLLQINSKTNQTQYLVGDQTQNLKDIWFKMKHGKIKMLISVS